MSDMSLYQQVIHQTRYARWNEESQRRETWEETTQRYVDYFDDFLRDNHDYALTDDVKAAVKSALYNMEVMPSMRTLMTAGRALDSAPVSSYNCSYLVVDSIRSFSEHMYVLMCGTGSGFSVEKRFVDKLPEVPAEMHPTDTVIVVADSRKGWCIALNQLLNLLYSGSVPKWDVSKVRPEGARLKTFGGYSSGPGVLEELFRHIIKTFEGAKGRKMRPIEVFSIMTYIAQIVVVGGVRRSATICLFDKDDAEMRNAKSGQWWVNNGHFAMANISAVFEGRPRSAEFMDTWRALVASGSGEPGILNRKALWDDAERIGRDTRDTHGARLPLGVNPCGEISLRPNEFCNLTGASIRPDDTLEVLIEKIKVATILGTWQACISDFDYLRKVWKDNVEDERLLGVCLAGIMDHPVLSKQTDESARWYQALRDAVWETNKEWAALLGINVSSSITAVKPAGNCRPWSALVTTDKGIFSMEDFAYGHATGVTTTRGTVKGFNDNGDEALLRVRTRYGCELDCTPNHRWLTQRGMVAASDLTTNDEIIVEIGKYDNTAHAKLRSLPAEALRTRYKQIEPVTLPTEMSSDLAWLLGYLWGDGALSINGYRIRFMDQNRDHLHKAARIIKEVFGLDSHVRECTDRDAATLEVGNKLLWNWLIVNDIVKYARTDRESLEMMPLAIRRSSKEDIIAFIAGMFDADGHSHTSSTGQTRAIFSNSKDGFSASFQHIALAVGLIFGRSLVTHGENFQKKKHVYLCALSPKSDENSIELLTKHSMKLSKSGFKRRREQKNPSFVVTSIEPLGYAPVFDVTTDTGEYLSGAFVSHNSGELHNVASGIHPRYAPYYLRTIRQSAGDPMTQFLKDNGIPWEVSKQNPRDVVFSFPVKSPDGAVCAPDLTALKQLEHWMHVKTHFATHTVSCTVYVRDHEWLEVGAWVFENFDRVTGVSFLPYDDHVYEQAPYQPITKEAYEEALAKFPTEIDWTLLAHYEGGKDTTTVSQEFACVSGACALT